MILTKEAILNEIGLGRIVVDPFEPSLVGENSIDVRLGAQLWSLRAGFKSWESAYRDLYRAPEDDWEPEYLYTGADIRHMEATQRRVKDWGTLSEADIPSDAPVWGQGVVADDDPVFLLRPGEFYLATTLERIGTRYGGTGDEEIVPEMRAKSTAGRQGLTVALCAGMGDVGYCSRWALEVRVAPGQRAIPLAVGTPIGQCVFHYTTPTRSVYGGAGRYQIDDGGKGDDPRFLPKPLKIVRTLLPEGLR